MTGAISTTGRRSPEAWSALRTHVGAFTELRDSFAWVDVLLHLGAGPLTAVPGRFLWEEPRSGPGFGEGLRAR
jgi:hypothetical protein